MRSMSMMLATMMVAGSVGFPAMAADNPIAERQESMKSVGKAVKAGAAMVKGQVPFEQDAAQKTLDDLHLAMANYGELFPVGTETGGETEASPKIWEDSAGFDEKVTQFQGVIKTAVDSSPADLDAYKIAFGEITGSCKSCHENYRVKKN